MTVELLASYLTVPKVHVDKREDKGCRSGGKFNHGNRIASFPGRRRSDVEGLGTRPVSTAWEQGYVVRSSRIA